jgi:hypothetical protein
MNDVRAFEAIDTLGDPAFQHLFIEVRAGAPHHQHMDALAGQVVGKADR